MDDREIEITTKVKLSDILKSNNSEKVGGLPIGMLFVLLLLCIFGIIMTRPQSNSTPSQTNTVIVK